MIAPPPDKSSPSLPAPRPSRRTKGLWAPLLFSLFIPLLRSGAPSPASVNADPSLPNIIIIVLDTVRVSATSLGRPSAGTTPFLKKLARRGAVFDNAYSTFDVTPDSHYSLFSGLKSGFMSHRDRPDQSLAFHLRRMGYDAVGVSANYNVRKKAIRAVRPFRLFISPAAAHLPIIAPRFNDEMEERAARLAEIYDAPKSNFNRNMNMSGAPTVNRVTESLLKRARRPALVFVNYQDAHDPYFLPAAFHEKAEQIPDGFSGDVRRRPLPRWMRHPKRRIKDKERRQEFIRRLKNVNRRGWNLSDDLSEAALEVYKKRYHEEIAYLDSQVKRVVARFDALGFLDNSLLIITADHGESFGEKGYLTHAMSNQGDKETTRHVPLLMVPNFGKSFKGRRVAAEVSIADIAPTIYALLGIDDTPFVKEHGALYGRSLLPYLQLKATAGSAHKVEKDRHAPALNADEDREALIKSLKALGYISEE